MKKRSATQKKAHTKWTKNGEQVTFKAFPWFKRAPVGAILNVEMPGANHLYWPDLDVDLAVESIEDPKAFPLVSRALPNTYESSSVK